MKARRRGRRSANGDGGNHTHNTLSAETQHVRIFYPFHPLHGLSLQVIRKPKRGDGAVSVKEPTGKRLKIPAWMLTPDSSDVQIAEQPHLSMEALLSCVSVPVEARTELIALMARILVAVYQAEGGRVDDGAFVQSKDQAGAPGSQGDRVLKAIQRETAAAEQGKPTPSIGPEHHHHDVWLLQLGYIPDLGKDCQEALEPHVHLRQASGGIARFTAEDFAAFVDRCPV